MACPPGFFPAQWLRSFLSVTGSDQSAQPQSVKILLEIFDKITDSGIIAVAIHCLIAKTVRIVLQLPLNITKLGIKFIPL